MKLLMIADDLTGALDTGVQLAGAGIRTPAVSWSGPFPDAEALVVNTESRHIPPETAYERVKAAAEAGLRAGAQIIYKKTDSALRGNIRAELRALSEICGRVDFVPAYPRLGRVTSGGVQYADGIPVSESAFGRDPFEPAREADARRLVSGAGEIVVHDAATDEDLMRLAEKLKGRRALAGCAGFAEYLPRMAAFRREPVPPPPHGLKLLFVSGSLHPVAREQTRVAREAGLTVLESEYCAAPEAAQREAAAEALAVRAEQAIREGDYGAVAVFGGDTLSALLSRLGISAVYPICALPDGAALCRAGNLWLVTKSGGFGAPDAAIRLVKIFR